MATNFCVHWSVDYFSYILFGLWCPVKENISTHLKACLIFIISVKYKCQVMYVQPNLLLRTTEYRPTACCVGLNACLRTKGNKVCSVGYNASEYNNNQL